MRWRLARMMRERSGLAGLGLAFLLIAGSMAFEEYGHLLKATEPAIGNYSIHDGDTITIEGERIRIIGLDAPEIGSGARCASEASAAIAARNRLSDLLADAEITLRRDGTDRYGRTLAYIYADGRDVAKLLIREKLARPYDGGHREGWCR
ncbi:thermonuclease family protein [Parvibaculum sp.]|uniref:thermonuclease family protein n=1 Tax=Parvibaculum sp. TaxID=2024848 RepID=UPI003918D776